MKSREGIFKLVSPPTKIGARGDDVDNEDIIDKMNKIDADNQSDEASDANNSDMGELDMDDGIQMEEDGAEEEKIQPKNK